MAETSDSREVWVLERDGFPALVDEDEFDCVSPHRFKHTCFQNGKRVDTESTCYIPAPTWRPIAELPEAWRDGRDVLVESVGGMQCVVRHSGGYWWLDTGEDCLEVDVGLYLDLAIPEVPR